LVLHEPIGRDLAAGFLTSLAQDFQESAAIFVIYKNVSPFAAIHDVINGTGIGPFRRDILPQTAADWYRYRRMSP